MPSDRHKHRKARFSLYLSAKNYKLFMAVSKLLSTSVSSEVDNMILAKLLFLSKDSTNKQISSLINSSDIDLLNNLNNQIDDSSDNNSDNI